VSFNLSLLFLPGILLMSLMWTTQGLSDELWHEREMGTLRRLASSPNTLTVFLAGKIIYGVIVMMAVFLWVLLLGFGYHQLDPMKFPYTLLLMMLAGVDFMLMFSLLAVFAPSRRAAGLIGTVLVLPLIMVGGSFFPFEAMPGWMVAVGRWTPNGLVLNQIKAYLFDNTDVASMAMTVGLLMAIGVALFGICAWRNRTFARA